MIAESLSPNLIVTNVNKSLSFYCDLLGFQFELGVLSHSQDTIFQRPNKDTHLGFAKVTFGDISIMIQSKKSIDEDVPDLLLKNAEYNAMMYMRVDSIDALYNKIVKNNITIVLPRRISWYGMDEFMIQDIDGNVLGIGAPCE